MINEIQTIVGNYLDNAKPTTLQTGKVVADGIKVSEILTVPYELIRGNLKEQISLDDDVRLIRNHGGQEFYIVEIIGKSQGGPTSAKDVVYDNTDSELESNRVQDAIDEVNQKADLAFQSASDGKIAIASAITGKGILAEGSETFTQLAGKIEQIETGIDTSDATAMAGDILAPKTAYGPDGKIIGTMPDRGTVNHNLAINGSYTIPAGYHNGSGKVTQSIPTQGAQTITPGTSNKTIPSGRYLTGTQTIKGDANLIPANILAGKRIFGVAGSVIAGKRYASGSISRSSFATMTFRRIRAGSSVQSIGNTSTPTMVVTGLNFTPSIIMAVSAYASAQVAFAFYFSGSPIVFCGDGVYTNPGRVSMHNGFMVSGGPNPVIVANGFNLPISNPPGIYTDYTWYAWE